ncbi:hypothetical protein Van01_58270 [Micromonospora andamanensis]|uniref:Uncharacterized protein n=1 Tax=Micromonospora andamanensis TaxID=1287068 RepID=A0ABQ4I3Z3_9ACTN|nr:hypothetical protein Van01_58270 [Micromonospora andamanensis]
MGRPLTIIPGLRQSVMFDVAVALYRRHGVERRPRVCKACGQAAPCPVRLHAELVIATAGADPQQFEDAPPPGHTGFRVGGRSRPIDDDALTYERHDD